MEIPRNVVQSARRLFAERFGLREPLIVRTAADLHPETKASIYLVAAVASGRHNDKAAELILDEAGRPLEIARELLPSFLPPSVAVPPEVTEPVRVRIEPAVNDLRLSECDDVTEKVTVTLPKSAVVAKVDVYFLADNTGSMGTILAAVKTGASTILSTLAGLGLDLSFGVGKYSDFPGPASSVFLNQQAVTATTADVVSAINGWIASGGGDGPEGQFYALDQIAEPGGGSIGWRAGSKRIVVWFGDAPAHDPICTAISGLSYEINEASVTAKLQAEGITVLGLGTTTGYAASLDDDPVATASDYTSACGAPGGATLQATRITAATDGIYVTGIDATKIVQTIIDQVKALLAIKNVHLEAFGAIAPFVSSITPSAGYGPLEADKEHVLEFQVSFTGDVTDCSTRDKVFTGSLNVVADGAVVGRKPTRITVPACKYTYAVKYVCGTQSDCGCGCGPVRPGVYATEINILNSKCKEAHITTRVVPLVFAGAATGRDPRVVQARPAGRLTLPPNAATMEDCCRLAELLYGAEPASPLALNVGFFEITSDQELHVTAVYTASDLGGNGVSIDVEMITHRLT